MFYSRETFVNIGGLYRWSVATLLAPKLPKSPQHVKLVHVSISNLLGNRKLKKLTVRLVTHMSPRKIFHV